MDESKIEKPKVEKEKKEEEIFDPEKMTEEEYKAGLDETVKKFVKEIDSSRFEIEDYRYLIGEVEIRQRAKKLHEKMLAEKTADPEYVSALEKLERKDSGRLIRHIETIDKLIELYEKDSFNDSKLEDIHYTATQSWRNLYKDFRERDEKLKTRPRVSDNSGPIDHLNLFAGSAYGEPRGG